MKKEIFIRALVLAVCLAFGLEAAAYEPVYTDGKKWVYSLNSDMGNVGTAFGIVKGDTVVGGRTVKKMEITIMPNERWMTLYIYKFPAYTPTFFEVSHLTSYYYEEGKKVYSCDEKGDLTLIMDFGAEVGAKFYTEFEANETNMYTPGAVEYTVALKDTVKLDGNLFPRFVLRRLRSDVPRLASFDDYNWQNEETVVWIEGVGPINGYDVLNCHPDYYRDEFSVTGCLFPSNKMFAISEYNELPDPDLSGIESVAADQPDESDDRIYDLNGIEVKHPRSGQTYIRGGHKFVRR